MADYELVEDRQIGDGPVQVSGRPVWPIVLAGVAVAAALVGGVKWATGGVAELPSASEQSSTSEASSAPVEASPASTIGGGIEGIPGAPPAISIYDERASPFRDVTLLTGGVGQPIIAFGPAVPEAFELGIEGEPLLAVDNWLLVAVADGLGVVDMEQGGGQLTMLVNVPYEQVWALPRGREVWVYSLLVAEEGEDGIRSDRFEVGSWRKLPSFEVSSSSQIPVAGLLSDGDTGVYEMNDAGPELRSSGSLLGGNADFAAVKECGTNGECELVMYDRSDWATVSIDDSYSDPESSRLTFMDTGSLAVLAELDVAAPRSRYAWFESVRGYRNP